MSQNEECQAHAVELQQQAKNKKDNKPRQKAGKFATQPKMGGQGSSSIV
jgi:hypothetical protein